MPKRTRDLSDLPPPAAVSHGGHWPARMPWLSLILTAGVLVSAGVAVKPVRNAATLADISEAYLVRPTGYVAIAPLSAIFDTLALLSVRQHIALFAGALVVLLGTRIWHGVRGTSCGGWRGHVLAGVVFLLVTVTTYAAAVMLPRPMAYLSSQDANILRVDFHSHTSHSRDARGSFTVDRNRAWHRAGGYDVAYVTDHATVRGAERGMAGNTVAGLEHPVLLQAIEATWTGEHVAILGAERTYRGLLTENLRDVDPQGLQLASLVPTREPLVIWNHPRDLTRLPPASGPATAGVRAIEISNGSPNGADRVRSKRAAIIALAERHNLALTTGSDNHGWGRVAPNWTLMRPGAWRGLTGDQLALRIESALRQGGHRSTRVVERVVAFPENDLALAFTLLTVPWRMLTTLDHDERAMWLVWIWALTAAAWWWRRSRGAP